MPIFHATVISADSALLFQWSTPISFVRCPWFGLFPGANFRGVIPFSEIVILDPASACVFISDFFKFIFADAASRSLL